MLPVDARLDSAADLPVETIDIDQVLAIMQADESRVNLVFLDACRDNPLTRIFARALPPTRALSVGSGLTQVAAGRGTLIAFATAPNKVALDGGRRRSQKDRTPWDRITKLADDYLPTPRILDPWPNVRFAVKHPRWEPSA